MKRLLVMVAAALVLSACNKDCEPQAGATGAEPARYGRAGGRMGGL